MFNIFKNKKDKQAKLLLDELEDSLALTYQTKNVKLAGNPLWKNIQQQPKEVKEAISLLAFSRLVDPKNPKYNHAILRRKIFKSSFNTKAAPSQESLLQFFKSISKIEQIYNLPHTDILFCFKYYKETFGKDSSFEKGQKCLTKIWDNHQHPPADFKKLIQGINKLDQDNVLADIFETTDVLGVFLIEKWSHFDEQFINIISLCWSQPQKSKPSKTWLKNATALTKESRPKDIETIHEIFTFLNQKAKAVVKWLNSIPTGTIDNPSKTWGVASDQYLSNPYDYYLSEENQNGVSHLVWLASLYNKEILNAIIGEFALSSFKKIKWMGSLCTKNGNACLFAFTLMPQKTGVTNLLNIRNKSQNKNIKKLADNHIKRKAKELNLTEEALLEISAPTFDLEGNLSNKNFGEYTGTIDITNLKKPITYWVNNKTNKQQKAVPSSIKQTFGGELKTFKANLKEISTAISVHTKRLENTYINNIEWDISEWKTYYIKHPFLSRFTSQLIWFLDDTQSMTLKDGQFIDAENKAINMEDYKTIKLWHPIYSTAGLVQNWRTFLINHQIQQPFKQAFREVYKVTDAEINTSTYSNRFAAHILYQHQFTALAKIRDWSYNLQGGFDSHNIPTKLIPHFNLKVDFWVEPVEDSLNDSNIFTYVTSDQVRILNNRELIQMENVPAIVFTEIMRDVDLFVGVCSIGNNPEWQDGGDLGQYWQQYSFGKLSETGKMRKQVLAMILPKLKIANKCTLEEKYLVVKGSIRDYKIHLGSGNILMSPNDQYLCIVPDRKQKSQNIFLPFDNDRTLSIILSKAFLLSEDHKIKDPTIIRQIKS